MNVPCGTHVWPFELQTRTSSRIQLFTWRSTSCNEQLVVDGQFETFLTKIVRYDWNFAMNFNVNNWHSYDPLSNSKFSFFFAGVNEFIPIEIFHYDTYIRSVNIVVFAKYLYFLNRVHTAAQHVIATLKKQHIHLINKHSILTGF